jgi:hypothetical protein
VIHAPNELVNLKRLWPELADERRRLFRYAPTAARREADSARIAAYDGAIAKLETLSAAGCEHIMGRDANAIRLAIATDAYVTILNSKCRRLQAKIGRLNARTKAKALAAPAK